VSPDLTLNTTKEVRFMPSKPKASFFPYAVMLCMAVTHGLLSSLGLYRLMQRPVDPGQAQSHIYVLYMMLFLSVGNVIISAAFSFAATQWLLERRRVDALPAYAPVGMAILSAALSLGWSFTLPMLFVPIFKSAFGDGGIRLAALVVPLLSYVVRPLIDIFSVWLVFRVLRRQEKPMAYPVQVRGRAVLIFTLFAWAWLMALLGMGAPFGSTFFSYQEIDPGIFYLASSIGSLVLLVPSFLGAVIALPAGMTATRPVRLWLAATLTLIVSAAVLVIAALAMAALTRFSLGDMPSNLGLAVVASLVGFFLSVPLCWLVVKLLTRKRAVFYAGDALPEEMA
jgi:hypothetical protein